MTPLVALALGVVSVQALGVVAGALATVGGVVLLLLARPRAADRVGLRPDRRLVARRGRARRRRPRLTRPLLAPLEPRADERRRREW